MAAVQRRKKVCLITPGHISSNPRLVKEAVALTKEDIQVHIVFTQYLEYLINFDEQILQANSEWTYDCLNWTQTSINSRFNRLLSGLRQRVSAKKEIIINRHFQWQYRKAVACDADLYIAHNLGAIAVAVKAAKTKQAKCGFDAEDFHRNESSNDGRSPEVQLNVALEDVYIPKLNYMTAASPLIAEAYSEIYQREVLSILNVFPETSIEGIGKNENKPIDLFWFSQTIGEGRGLEDVILSMAQCRFRINLQLLGKVTTDYKNKLLNMLDDSKSKIIFHDSIPPDEIFNMASQFNIGLASECSVPLNRDICLTNKVFTYLQSGLAILATSTQAQTAFMEKYPLVGRLYNSSQGLSNLLFEYHNDRELLHETQQAAYQLGQTELNWDVESKKWFNTISNCLTED